MYKSYCITIRPRDGLTDKTANSLLDWLKKQQYAVAVIEMEAEARHIHIQIWNDKTKARGDVCKAVQRICERTIQDWDAAQLKVLRSGVKIAYSDWYLDYLTDNDNKGPVSQDNILIDNPPEKTLEFYPSEQEQEDVQRLRTATDPRFAQLEIECLKYLGENGELLISMKNVAQFLCYAMFEARSIKCVTQQRDRTALCKTLYHYMIKSTDTTMFLEKSISENKIDIKYNNLVKSLEGYQYETDPEEL